MDNRALEDTLENTPQEGAGAAQRLPLCRSDDLQDGGLAVPFDVRFGGLVCRAFAIRYQGQVHAYVNRCSHVAMELDWQPNHVFDDTGQWLLCATHGAHYHPATGACAGGPCRGGLHKIDCSEARQTVFWHTAFNVQPVRV